MCEQILKKNIAGRIPETTRSRNLTILTNQMHHQHIINRQTVSPIHKEKTGELET